MPDRKKRAKPTKPTMHYTQVIQDSNDPGYINRLLVATPTTGTVRMEWVQSRYGQIIPVNWSQVQMVQYMSSFIPLRYSVADAQNIIIREAVDKGFEWLLLIEHDTCPPPDAFIRINEYIRKADVPVVSGLYYTKSEPSEPLLFRGRGTSYYDNWKMGDKVWVDGVPTGFLLISVRILREMWNDSKEYEINGTTTRQVFETPSKLWFDEETGQFNTITGTSDLDWCTKVIEGKYFAKAGWPLIQRKKYPFLVDTKIFCKHITEDGQVFPR